MSVNEDEVSAAAMRSTRCWAPTAGSGRPMPWSPNGSPAIAGELKRKQQEAESLFRRLGITFAVYGTEKALEKLIPFDIIPRIISAVEWRRLERASSSASARSTPSSTTSITARRSSRPAASPTS